MAQERRLWEHGNDPATYQSILDEGAICLMYPMDFVPKEQAVEMSKKGEPRTDVKFENVSVKELGPDSAALAYHASVQNGGKPYRGSVASVYIKRSDEWKLAVTAHQPWPEERQD